MRYVPVLALLVFFALLFPACGASPTATPTSVPPVEATPTAQLAPSLQVEVKGFSLLDITIPTGAAIEWTNTHFAPHTITSGTPGASDGVFGSGTLEEDDRFEFTFMTAGTFDYYCTIHPDSMRATIEVADGGGFSTSGGLADDGGEVAY